MQAWEMVLVAFLTTLAGSIVITMVYSELVEIYFKAKLKYISKLIGGLGKVLGEAGHQLGGDEKD